MSNGSGAHLPGTSAAPPGYGRERPAIAGPRCRSPRRIVGQVTTEYILVTLAVIAAFFIPFGGDRSAVVIFLDAVRAMHAAGSFALSLP